MISLQMNNNPEVAVIVAGDFNHVELKAVFPKFHHYINFPMRDNNTLDQVYCNIPGAYKAVAAPHLGMSDHISVNLIPAYKPLICRTTTNHQNLHRPSNKKPWLDNTVKLLLKACDSAYRSGDKLAYSIARKELKKGIKLAKSRYKQRIEEHFENNNPHSMWRGIKTITDYKRSDYNSTLPDILNTFYARF
ncbi:hypothetical protein L3Q82_010883 [Scortum barcoo]|uniref:Uncharacterized protein n=1 Tax=Scortum barcoo TaxID=214431 RepID=A0ACB8W8B7_9TELE|nr:hypothetical protein L3Q82_010883 [Scortum barcoo]